MYIRLPELDEYHRWVSYIGEAILKQVEYEIGGQRLDRHDPQYLHAYNALNLTGDEQKVYYKMIGHTPELYNKSYTDSQGHIRWHTSPATDIFIPLIARTNFANEMNADLFVSIHCDAFHNTTSNGMSVHVHPECSLATNDIAKRICMMLAERFPDHRNRGVKESNFHVLRETKMPAVLVECEFLSNPEARRFLREPENQLGLARTICKSALLG